MKKTAVSRPPLTVCRPHRFGGPADCATVLFPPSAAFNPEKVVAWEIPTLLLQQVERAKKGNPNKHTSGK